MILNTPPQFFKVTGQNPQNNFSIQNMPTVKTDRLYPLDRIRNKSAGRLDTLRRVRLDFVHVNGAPLI